MIIPIRYADSFYELDLPDKNLDGLIEPSNYEPLDLNTVLENNQLPNTLVSGSFRVLVVINDAFRSTPSHLILNTILPELEQNNQVKIIIATGLHEKPSEDEYKVLIGRHYERYKNSVYWSDSRDLNSFQTAGKWSDGGDIYLHKLFFWAERVIVIGSVEPHYFAGFTGGIKSIMPGLAYYKTTEYNHQKAIDINGQSGLGGIVGSRPAY
jgi:nickel-dependent lactate racemase